MTKKITVPIISTVLLMSMIFSPTTFAASGQVGTAATAVGVKYKTHIQDKGWESVWKTDGSLSGTVGESKRLEAMRIELTGSVPDGAEIQTYVHVQNEGDLGPFSMGDLAGTEGKGLRMERIKLVLKDLPGYTLKYNVQVQNIGWLKDETDDSTWFVSGDTAGTTGRGYRLEAIRIKLVEVNKYLQFYYEALSSVEQYMYTEESWADYQVVVKANVVTEDSTNTQILAATRAILAAQADLVEGMDFRAYMAAINAVKEVECTPDTWVEYQQVLDENVMTQDNTQAEIDAATAIILKAQKKLQMKVNLTAYLNALESVREADYTAGSWAEYQQVLANNVMNENNSQTEVDAATEKIVNAQKKMVRKFDFTAYDALLAAVKEEDYTSVSWMVYQKVVDANAVTENDTQTDIETAIKNIEAAQTKLVRAGDLTEYQAVLNSVKKADYTAVSWTAYKKVLEANEMTERNTQAEIDVATASIMEAQKILLKLAGDLEEYENALAKVEEDNYTKASWAAYKKVVDANVVTPASGQVAIDAATAKILAAQTKLVPVGEMEEYEAALANVKEDNYTTASWAAYQKVVDANEIDRLSSQVAIDAATAKILAAQKKLVPVGEMEKYLATLAAVVKTDYTSASWATYMKVVDANEVDRYSGQTAIDAAIAKIKAAQKNLVKAGVMTAYNTAVAAYPASSFALYTSKSWAAYQKVLDANVMTPDKGQAAIDAATEKIKAAQKTLVTRGITIKYEEAYSAKNESDYTSVSWAAYQKVLDASVLIYDPVTHTSDNLQSVIDAATAKIVAAQKKLVYRAGVSLFNQYKALVEAALQKKDSYTKASWTAYKKIADANVMTADKSTAEIEAAIRKIEIAQEDLVVKSDTSIYDEVYHAYDGKVADYTTAGWTAYQKILDNKANIMTVENSQADVNAALARIRSAQAKLQQTKVPAELKYYIEAITAYADRRTEFTDESWRDYQLIITTNYVDKDSTAIAIIAATQKILDAQKKLVSHADMSPFRDAIALYQENKRVGDEYADRVTDESWNDYADLVEKYASFEKDNNWNWNQNGSKDTDITQASGQTAVTSAANTLNDMKEAFEYIPAYKTAYAAYDEAMKLEDGKTPESYTTTSYGLYTNQKSLNAIADDARIKTDLGIIEAKTDNMITARDKLVERASVTIVNQFNVKIAEYEASLNSEMHWDPATGTYIIEDGYYTLASWLVYENVYKKYKINADTKLDPTDDVEATYEDAIQELVDAREDLVFTAKHAAAMLNQTDLQSPSVTTGTDLLAKARTFVTAPGFTVTITSPVGIPNVGVDANGVITGATGTTATISFKISADGDASNFWSVTYYNIPIS